MHLSALMNSVIVILQSYSELSKVIINHSKRVYRIISDYLTLAPQSVELLICALG